MKKWFYVLFPTILLAIFLVFYLSSRSETLAREATQREEAARTKAEADKKKAEAEATAQADAEKRNIQRANDEAKAAKDKEDKYNAEMAKIKAETDKANGTADMYSKQVSELTIELENLHKQKDNLTRESFDLLKRIELSEVARRNAELEIQRYDEMIANRADQSFMTKMPPAPAPEKS
jgi:translation initiation factor IF-2